MLVYQGRICSDIFIVKCYVLAYRDKSEIYKLWNGIQIFVGLYATRSQAVNGTI